MYPKGPAGHVNHGDVLADGAAHHALAVMHHVADQPNLDEGKKIPRKTIPRTKGTTEASV